MASSITSSIGLGSGIDIGAIVKVLVESDTSAKSSQIKRQTADNNAMLSGVGSLRSALTTFQSALNKLNDSTAPSFNAYAATSANESVVKVTAANTAVAGSYAINVSQLATGSKVASQAFAGGTSSSISSGELTISQSGKEYKLQVPSGATLQTVRDQINKQFTANGITANIVTDSTGSRLVLGSTTTGAGSDLSVSGIPELEIDGTQKMAGNGAGYISAMAQNAKLTIDGLPIESASNTVKNAISGLSLELTGVSASGTLNTGVTVGSNNDGLQKSIQSFVDAYNALTTSVNSLTATSLDADGNTVLGPLTGDATTRSLLADIRSVLTTNSSGDRLQSLSQLGVNTTQNGTLEFNTTKFNSAINDKKLGNEVQGLFTGVNGLIRKMSKAMDPYNSTGGILDSRKSALDKVGRSLTDQQSALDRRIADLTASLTTKYTAMDTLVGRLKAQANQITSVFDALNAQAKNS